MITEKITGTTIDAVVRNELTAIVCQAMTQHERKKEADKAVFRRICKSLDERLESFDYTVPDEYTDRNGRRVTYNREVPCRCKIKDALSALVRVACQVEAVVKLPSEKEANIRQFMIDTLECMKTLNESVKSKGKTNYKKSRV